LRKKTDGNQRSGQEHNSIVGGAVEGNGRGGGLSGKARQWARKEGGGGKSAGRKKENKIKGEFVEGSNRTN